MEHPLIYPAWLIHPPTPAYFPYLSLKFGEKGAQEAADRPRSIRRPGVVWSRWRGSPLRSRARARTFKFDGVRGYGYGSEPTRSDRSDGHSEPDQHVAHTFAPPFPRAPAYAGWSRNARRRYGTLSVRGFPSFEPEDRGRRGKESEVARRSVPQVIFAPWPAWSEIDPRVRDTVFPVSRPATRDTPVPVDDPASWNRGEDKRDLVKQVRERGERGAPRALFPRGECWMKSLVEFLGDAGKRRAGGRGTRRGYGRPVIPGGSRKTRRGGGARPRLGLAQYGRPRRALRASEGAFRPVRTMGVPCRVTRRTWPSVISRVCNEARKPRTICTDTSRLYC